MQEVLQKVEVPGKAFRTYLKNEMHFRSQAASGKSLRSFARDLKISASGLSMVVNSRTPVTIHFVKKVGEKLGLSREQILEHQVQLLKEMHEIDAG